jgi:hypothetical protein
MRRPGGLGFLFGLLVGLGALPPEGQAQERATAITPPTTPFPTEAQSKGVTRFSFVVYGDTRGQKDGVVLQPDHSLVVESVLGAIKRLRDTPFPVKAILQSGDAVAKGQDPRQWNVSFVPLINRLTTEGDVSYFLAPGNHDVSSSLTPDAPAREVPLRNFLDVVGALIPKDGSPRRLSGYPTYAFGYGNTFVLAIDADIASDEKQLQWVREELEGLDRSRYVNVFVLCHHAPFSSGHHGGPTLEPETVSLRSLYMPLFRTHHVRAVFSGHEHLFEHWVERYTDSSGAHRMDLIVSGGGGAPIYTYSGEPDLKDYLKANEASHVELEHLVKPSVDPGLNPHHYLIVRVDGEHISLEVVGVDWGRGFAPYRSSKADLAEPSR